MTDREIIEKLENRIGELEAQLEKLSRISQQQWDLFCEQSRELKLLQEKGKVRRVEKI